MAQEPETEKNASGIAHAAKRKWGYDAEQVDAFLERAHMLYEGEGAQLTQHDIQNVSFELVKGGYVIAQVDAALARLERAVVDKQTTWEISQHGRVAWKAQTEDLFKKLDAHAEREHGQRFKPGEGKNPSYDRKQVDSVIDKCLTKAAGELGVEEVSEADAKAIADTNSQTLSNVIFTQRKGKRGYDERQVDYYLAACAQLLTRLESYARVADFVGEPSEEAMAAAAPSVAPASSDSAAGETQMIAPLFAAPSATVPAAPVPPTVPTVTPSEEDSFDALNKAEHEIFTSAVTSPVSLPRRRTLRLRFRWFLRCSSRRPIPLLPRRAPLKRPRRSIRLPMMRWKMPRQRLRLRPRPIRRLQPLRHSRRLRLNPSRSRIRLWPRWRIWPTPSMRRTRRKTRSRRRFRACPRPTCLRSPPVRRA